MRSMSIGVEPIAVTSLYPTPQTVSEGSFAQTLKDAVDVGVTTPVSEQPVQNGELQKTSEALQPQQTPQAAQDAPQATEELQPQETQTAQEPQQTDEAPQLQQEVEAPLPQQIGEAILPQQTDEAALPQQTDEAVLPQQTDEAALPQQTDEAVMPQQTTEAIQPQQTTEATLPQRQTRYIPEVKQAEAADIPAEALQPKEPAQPDPDLMKELADLLADTEKLMTAPQRMQEKLNYLIAKAFNELTDPEAKEEEFTEKVLEFLLKFIDRAYGGEKHETSVFKSSDEEDTDVQDVLLQAVVQMLDNIRSENAETNTPNEAEDEEAVSGIPSTDMAKEYVGTSANELLGEEARQIAELEAAADKAITEQNTAAVPQPETRTEAPVQAVSPAASADEQLTAELPEKERIVEAVHTAQVRQPVEAEKVQIAEAEKAQPVEAEKAEPAEAEKPVEEAGESTLYQAAEQAAESIIAVIVRSEKPALAEDSLLKKTGYIHERIETSMPKPAEELEELTRLVKGDVRSQQPQLDLRSDKQTEAEQIKPAVKLEAIGETVPFEAAIARSVPQITLTHPFEGSQSGAEQIVTQIASEIFNQLPEKAGTTTFVMTLNPESLGKVTVKLVEEAGKISVSVTAHERRTAEILSQRFDNLQTAMKDNGTQLEKYQVVYAPEKDESAGQQNFDGSSKNPYVKQETEESEGDGEFAELLQQAV